MLSLMLSLALLAPADPTAADLQALRATVVADMAAGKLPQANNLFYVLSYVDNAILWNSGPAKRKVARSMARSYILCMKGALPWVFQYNPTLTAADKALLMAQVNQVLADLTPL